MENKELEEICEEYRIKPYRQHGSDLIFYFGKIMSLTDKWTPIPFKENERFIDFARGLQETGQIGQIPFFRGEEHMVDRFTGFVKLNPEKPIVRLYNFYPWIGFIDNGTFKYMQAETVEKNGIILNKKSIFIKDRFAVFANAAYDFASLNESTNQYECIIQNTGREATLDTNDDYAVNILQTSHSIRIGINTMNSILTRPPQENLESPLVELKLEDNKDKSKINYLIGQFSLNPYIFESLDSMGEFFSDEKIMESSEILNILKFHYGANINRNNLPTFSDAVKTIKHLSSMNTLEMYCPQDYLIKTQTQFSPKYL